VSKAAAGCSANKEASSRPSGEKRAGDILDHLDTGEWLRKAVTPSLPEPKE
jgi:hypothetical protein